MAGEEFTRPLLADEMAITIADLLRANERGLDDAHKVTRHTGPVVIHMTAAVVYVIEVHTVKNGPV